MLWRFIIAGTKEHFESHKHPQPPQKIHPQPQEVVTHLFKALHGAQGLMWGNRGSFLPAVAMVVAVVMPVVFCAKATEKRNKNTKISWWLSKKFTYNYVM
jgi:hypothetical protein